LVGAVGIESTHLLNIKDFCGAAWSSKELKVIGGNFACPLNAPKKFALLSSSFNIYDPNIHVMAANPQHSLSDTSAFGRSRPAADASREVVERWLLDDLM
jgi:hypothetical protein